MSMAELMRAVASLPTDKRPGTFLILSAALLLTLPAPAAQLYVATTGSDTNSGSRRKPFATLERARDEVELTLRDGVALAGGAEEGEAVAWKGCDQPHPMGCGPPFLGRVFGPWNEADARGAGIFRTHGCGQGRRLGRARMLAILLR